jgi:hypothetical protein
MRLPVEGPPPAEQGIFQSVSGIFLRNRKFNQATAQAAELRFDVILLRGRAKSTSRQHVRYSPIATELMRRNELPLYCDAAFRASL